MSVTRSKPKAKTDRQECLSYSIQIKIAKRLAGGRVFGLLHRFFEFLGENIFFVRFLKKRVGKFVFALTCCSARIPCAFSRSTFGPAFTGASCESTAPKTASTTSFAWQHGHVTCRLSGSFFPIAAFYAILSAMVTAALPEIGPAKKKGHDISCPLPLMIAIVLTPSPDFLRA